MSAPLKTYEQTITEATSKCIASPALVSGAQPSDAPAGKTLAPSAPQVFRASRSAPPEKVLVSMIQGTCGQIGSDSSMRPWSRASLGLQRSLVSRLQARASGSILYKVTWKLDVLPSRQPIFRLRASGAGVTSDNAFTGWPTATTPSGGQTWPPGTTATGLRPDGSKATVNLEQVAKLAGWTTTTTSDGTGSTHNPGKQGGESLRTQARLAGWSTTTADSRNGRNATAGRSADQIGKHHAGETLVDQTSLSGWATTTTRDWKDGGAIASDVKVNSLLGRQVWEAVQTGYFAKAEQCDPLNVEHSRWLLRIPAEWVSCGASAMRSISKRR